MRQVRRSRKSRLNRLAAIDEQLDRYVEKDRSDSAEYAAMIRAALLGRDRR
jgi:hypothetical protein